MGRSLHTSLRGIPPAGGWCVDWSGRFHCPPRKCDLVEGRDPQDGYYLFDSLSNVGYFRPMDEADHQFEDMYLVESIGTLATCNWCE